MVKKIDEINYPPLEDHIGIRLWRASELWKITFDEEMIALGHVYFGEARSGVLRHVAPDGTRQSEIVQRMGLSKQAVQQLIDELEAEGVVQRQKDAKDGRGKLVTLTQKGVRTMHDANKVKRKLQRKYADTIGSQRLATLMQLLGEFTEKA
jgi:DNA-binding MarR family transcriptional regulator